MKLCARVATRLAPVLLIAIVAPVARGEDRSFFTALPASARQAPSVDDPQWNINPIDAWIYARLSAAGLSAPAEIDRRQWLRRVTFDLIGLPPTPDELSAFVQDARDDDVAYAAVVDRLLASPHYGERWARHWLDVVRYADTDGFAIDAERPRLWRYRDYVIRHFNQDRPYSQFVREQIAGDELATGQEAIIATSFYRLGPYEADNMTPENRQQDFLNEITTTIGTAFMGLTVGCARCHDHKYDPIPQSDFYRLQALIKPAWRGELPAALLTQELLGDVEAQKSRADAELATRTSAIEAQRSAMREQLAKALGIAPAEIPKETFAKALKGEKIPIPAPAAQAGMSQAATTEVKPSSDTFEFSDADREKLGKLKQSLREFYDAKRFDPSVDSINFKKPPRKPRDADNDEDDDDEEAQAIDDTSAITHILMNGDPFAPGELVQPGCLSAVSVWSTELENQIAASATDIKSRRIALANWLASPQNPLTMRVYVNRIWQYHFGTGIVRTANDFGVNGSGASHPELLDFLTAYFLDQGGYTKPLHRLIVLSRTYRSSSEHEHWEQCATVDPDNRLLWHAPLRRLEAETVRDALLAVSGRLNTQQGGPGFYEQLPDGMPDKYEFFEWHPSADEQRRRRSIYMFQRRNLMHPFMESFDAADFSQSCERRLKSITASQALTLINGHLATEASEHLAHRLRDECGDDATAQVQKLFALALGRAASDEEVIDGTAFLSQKATHYASSGTKESASQSPAILALRDLCLVTLNSNEFLYLD